MTFRFRVWCLCFGSDALHICLTSPRSAHARAHAHHHSRTTRDSVFRAIALLQFYWHALLFLLAHIQTIWHEILSVSRDLHFAPMCPSYQHVLVFDRALQMYAICILSLHSAFFGNRVSCLSEAGCLILGLIANGCALSIHWLRNIHRYHRFW
ncbi:hypothetical protein FIBSPDRAFT_433328 [Athelia psychrophila]|uniref:Uncharacterized protein n=1 Tax=Athelia psychrophila TaxID=1759441 RepID=A0A166VI83_9AGAM|nr:hypothetical protein FIBSPDRAFT_433328 [Fibularhizoctonia sp. CBS 109695]